MLIRALQAFCLCSCLLAIGLFAAAVSIEARNSKTYLHSVAGELLLPRDAEARFAEDERSARSLQRAAAAAWLVGGAVGLILWKIPRKRRRRRRPTRQPQMG